MADLERSIAAPAPSFAGIIGPSAAVAATTTAPVSTQPPQRGVTDREIRFGIAAPFSGSAKELGRQMKLGIDSAFNRVNEAGGVDGRMLRLVAADDGYEPTRTTEAMKQLYEKEQVFGIIGNVGTPTAVVAVPFALERRVLSRAAWVMAEIASFTRSSASATSIFSLGVKEMVYSAPR